MGDTTESIDQGFRKAAATGDLRQFKALEQLFPARLEALRDSDLLDIAATHKHADIILYLALHHRFEVSPDFEKQLKAYGGDLFAEGVNEYTQTLEVTANAAIGFARDGGRSIACYDLMNHFAHPGPQSIHPEFYHAAANGDLEKFLSRYTNDARFDYCVNRHTGRMVSELHHALPIIYEEAARMLKSKNTISSEGREI